MKIINNIQNLLKKFFLNSFIVLISLILSFYALEIYLLYKSGYRLFKDLNYQTPLEEWQSYPSSYIRTDTLKYISNQNNFVPLSGLSKQKIIVCNEGGFWSRYTSDRYGFNNPDNVWDKTFTDIVIVGDSFTEGACVNEYDTISSNLRKISDLNIINLGRGGTASLSHLALLSEYTPKNIKSIVWIYYENDVIDLDFELSSLTLKKYLNDEKFTQNLKYKQNLIDNLHLNDHKSLIKKLSKKDRNDEILRIYGSFNTDRYSYLKLYTLRNFIRERFFEKEKNIQKEKKHRLKFNQNFKTFKKIINIVNDNSLKNNIDFYFVYLSSRPKYAAGYDGKNYEDVINFIKDSNIKLIDMHDIFKKHPDPLSMFPFRRQLHYNEKGHKFVAENIYDFILKNKN